MSSDDDEEMNISSKEKTKATMNETLQNFQLDMGKLPNWLETVSCSYFRCLEINPPTHRLLAKSELCVDQTHIFTHCLTLLKLYKNHPGKLPLDFITLPTVPRMQNLESSVKRSKQARLQAQPRSKISRVF